jgi:hypothetical protein
MLFQIGAKIKSEKTGKKRPTVGGGTPPPNGVGSK